MQLRWYLQSTVVCTLIVFVQVPAFAQPSVSELMERYGSESRSEPIQNASDYQRAQFYEHWLNEFQQIIDRNPGSPETRKLIEISIPLATATGKYDVARALGERLALDSPEWNAKLRWYTELGEITETQFAVSQNAAHADQSSAYFVRALEAERLRSVTESYDWMTARDTLVSSAMLAYLRSTTDSDPSVGAQLYDDGFERLKRIRNKIDPESMLALDRDGYDEEFFLAASAKQWQLSGHADFAIARLAELQALGTRRRSASEYVIDIADMADPGRGSQYEKFMESWLATSLSDSGTPLVKWHLAFHYIGHGKQSQGFRLFRELYDNNREALIGFDPAAAERKSGGYWSIVLYSLISHYFEMGLNDEARNLAEEFMNLYPNDTRASYIRSLIPILKDERVDPVAALEINKDIGTVSSKQESISPEDPQPANPSAADSEINIANDSARDQNVSTLRRFLPIGFVALAMLSGLYLISRMNRK